MNPRRLVVEDRALALADELHEHGHQGLAARLRGTVPEHFGFMDEHVPLPREALGAVLRDVPTQGPIAQKVVDVLDDLPAFIGVRGRAYVSRDHEDGTYRAIWEDDDWLESGPARMTLEAALAWAERRSDDVQRLDL